MSSHKFLEHKLIEDDKCNWEFFALNWIFIASSNPQFKDKRERWSYVAHNLGFPSPCTSDEFLNGLDNLYGKLKKWSNTDRKTYWKYMDIIGDVWSTLIDDSVFEYRGNDVIIVKLTPILKYKRAIKAFVSSADSFLVRNKNRLMYPESFIHDNDEHHLYFPDDKIARVIYNFKSFFAPK